MGAFQTPAPGAAGRRAVAGSRSAPRWDDPGRGRPVPCESSTRRSRSAEQYRAMPFTKQRDLGPVVCRRRCCGATATSRSSGSPVDRCAEHVSGPSSLRLRGSPPDPAQPQAVADAVLSGSARGMTDAHRRPSRCRTRSSTTTATSTSVEATSRLCQWRTRWRRLRSASPHRADRLRPARRGGRSRRRRPTTRSWPASPPQRGAPAADLGGLAEIEQYPGRTTGARGGETGLDSRTGEKAGQWSPSGVIDLKAARQDPMSDRDARRRAG
jgi:hypothetical protein